MSATLEEKLREAIENKACIGGSLNFFKIKNEEGREMFAKNALSRRMALKEAEMGVLLKQEGVCVPGNYRVITPAPEPSYWLCEDDWFVIMDYVEGKDIYKHLGILYDTSPKNFDEEIKEEYARIIGLFRDEVRKVLKIGIAPYEVLYTKNSIYNAEEDKVYLIDFEHWRKPIIQEELEVYHEIIEDKLLRLSMRF